MHLLTYVVVVVFLQCSYIICYSEKNNIKSKEININDKK